MNALPQHFAPPSSPAPDLHSPVAAAAALRTFFNIAQAWQLSNDEQQRLLGCGRTMFFEWKAGRVKRGLDAATLERLSHLFAIYAGLQILLPIPERANAWIRRPNTAPLFGGRSALDRLLAGQVADLFVVRQYLDAQRGGWA
ncbi:MbcA/ParS/Xre antitoxin family protein [Paucibacter sp. APW11]|uniref:MbcA/ParS/Xre antitoxin family protein n=1 Tax=Roseateles aquae TaxID=3077235 RepID=A0ABU3P8Y4_9BURK|nr:MbcA/ParS/Xre antitoxin family protein [Paucibacter sp. APW11]MDT8999020.1 MbcA/ParS/Xre antitoxin family protein [Paucibacter sp. APW11]